MELDLGFIERRREITMRNTNARRYSERIQKRNRQRKENIETGILLFLIAMIMLLSVAFSFETNRYAVPSENGNGIHYTYVEEVNP